MGGRVEIGEQGAERNGRAHVQGFRKIASDARFQERRVRDMADRTIGGRIRIVMMQKADRGGG